MKVLVCGGRTYKNRKLVYKKLDELNPSTIIHGGAKGADTLASDWCKISNCTEIKVEADWSRYGYGAGPIRNQAMIDLKPDVVLAFPGGKGTTNMIKLANLHKVKVIKIENQTTDRNSV